jgi:hypothetical protein
MGARGEFTDKAGKTAFDSSLVPAILGLGAMTIKISALPLAVAAALFYLFHGTRFWRRTLITGIISLVLVAPMIAYSTITSGCLLFPVASTCTELSWSVGAQAARNISEQAMIWGRWGGPAPAWANSWNWLWPWLKAGVTARNAALGLIMTALAISGLALSVLFGQRRTGRWVTLFGLTLLALFLMLRAQNVFTVCAIILGLTTLARRFRERNWLLAISLPGIALSLTSAPDLRFGLGYVAVLLGCFVIAYGEALKAIIIPDLSLLQGVAQERLSLALLLIAAGILMASGRLLLREQLPPTSLAAGVAFRDAARFHLLVPPRLPSAPTTRARLNDVDYYRPENGGGQCWDSELPCAWEALPEDLVLRDPVQGIAAGFARRRRP